LKQLVVFSLDKTGNPASETDKTVVLGMLHEVGLTPREALGVYNGVAERSFMVEIEDKGLFALIKSIAIKFKQESILTVNLSSFDAILHHLTPLQLNRQEVIGKWVKTDQINKLNMTLDLNDMQIYIVK